MAGDQDVHEQLIDAIETVEASTADGLAAAAGTDEAERAALHAEAENDLATAHAHWSRRLGVSAADVPPRCAPCGEQQPCSVIQDLRRKYGLLA